MELVQTLMNQLNISDDQASGGVGLLMNLAKDQLSSGEFDQVKGALPEVEGMMNQAPETGGGLGGMLGGLTSAFGGDAGQLGNLAELASGFSKLDLDTGMIAKFIPIVLSYAQSQGGDMVQGLLSKALQS